MRRIHICVVLLALVAGVIAAAGPSAARRAPAISMYAVRAAITVGDEPHFGYTTADLPADAVVQLQRLATSGWTTLKTIPQGTRQYTFGPALSALGRYQYRIQAVQGSTLVARTNVHYIYAYGTVRVSALCVPMQNTCRHQHNPLIIGGENFYYAMDIGAATHPNYFAGAHLDKTSCRSINLQYVGNNYQTDMAWLKVHQPGVPPDQGTSTLPNMIGRMSATLTGGQFFLDASLQPRTGAGLLIGGYASCYSTTGVPPA